MTSTPSTLPSNSEAARVAAAVRSIKIWVTENGQIEYQDRNPRWSPRSIDIDDIVTAVTRSIDHAQAA